MSHVDWPSRFKSARYGGPVDASAGPWRTLEDAGELAPADLIANEVLYFLRNDSVLSRVFVGFDRVPWISDGDAREFPRCSVHLVSNTNAEQPTNTSVEELSVFVGTLWALEYVQPAADGAASVATVLSHIKRVLRAPKNRVVTVTYGSSEVPLAVDHSLGAEGYGPLHDMSGRPAGVIHEIESKYRLHIDRLTGRLVNLPAAS